MNKGGQTAIDGDAKVCVREYGDRSWVVHMMISSSIHGLPISLDRRERQTTGASVKLNRHVLSLITTESSNKVRVHHDAVSEGMDSVLTFRKKCIFCSI